MNCLNRFSLLVLPLAFLLVIILSIPASAEEWKLVFEDDFERAELGPNWDIPGGKIENGKLVFGLEGPMTARITRPFKTDVRVEMKAEANPAKQPCDLSILLATSSRTGFDYGGYLLAFGGMSNSGHQIIGGGSLNVVRIRNADNVIVPGKVHTISGTRDGNRLTLEADGALVLSTTDADPIGGVNFDHVGLVTWNGMFVHEVKVYEREPANPNTPPFLQPFKGLAFKLDPNNRLVLNTDWAKLTPEIEKALELYNNGKYREAEAAFMEMDDIKLRASGVAWCVGHIHYIETFDDMKRAGKLLQEMAAANPGDENLQNYGLLGREVAKFTLLRGEGLPNTGVALNRVLAAGPGNDPFYEKAEFYKLRFARAGAMEGGDHAGLAELQEKFKELYKRYPENPSLRELSGESVPWGEELIVKDTAVPAWARAIREVYARQAAILHEWFTNRQLPDGQLGGGWGDDVEILRGWAPVAFISNGDPELTAGIERLCEGMWKSALSEYGFSDDLGDVEHAAEPSADTVPSMVPLRYGDPLWLERNMLSCKSIRDYYTGIDQTNNRIFKSSHYGGNMVGRNVMEGGDSYYNARTMKHAYWLAWYGNKGARDLFLSWAESWYQHTMTELPDKPRGWIPGAIWWPTGSIIAPGAKHWYDNVGQYDAAGPGMAAYIQNTFLAAYQLTGDRKWLEPMATYMRWTAYGPLIDKMEKAPEEGSFLWAVRGHQGSADKNTIAQYWWYSGDQAIREYALRFATPTQRYLITQDLDHYVSALDKAAQGMRYNFLLQTKELLQTDRAGLPGMVDSFGAYTGGFSDWRECSQFTSAVSWDVPNTDFAALVTAMGDRNLRVWVYNFNKETIRMGLRLWQLRPGEYEGLHGPILPSEGVHSRYGWNKPESFLFRRRGDIYYVNVPPGVAYAIDLRQVKEMEVPAEAPDLAIADRDVSFQEGKVTVTLHNVGLLPAENIVVALEAKDGNTYSEITRMRIPRLDSPDDLDARVKKITFEDTLLTRDFRVVVDPDNEIDELFEGNNIALAH